MIDVTVCARVLVTMCLAVLALTPGVAFGADPAPTADDIVQQPYRCADATDTDCSKDLKDVHCGDTRYETLRGSALMKQNTAVDPLTGTDVCSFGSNRIRVFQPVSKVPGQACGGASETWVVPPGIDGEVTVQAWGGAGGDYLDKRPTGYSALGGFGGFAQFDGSGTAATSPVGLASGDVLQITVGCKPRAIVGTPNSGGAAVANGGGGSTAVTWIGHVDMDVLLSNSSELPPWDNDAPRPGQGTTTLPSYNASVERARQTRGIVDKDGHIVLVIAGGGGGAGRSAGGGDGEIGGGSGAYAAGTGLTRAPGSKASGGRGGNGDGKGIGGAAGSFDGGPDQGTPTAADGTGGHGGDLFSGAPGAWGFASGGSGGYANEPGGGGGAGYGGGGAGTDDGRTSGAIAGGGGGGGSFSWGGDATQSATLDQDGMVAIQWKPTVLGGPDCVASCRAVWATCTVIGGHAGGQQPVFTLPPGATGANGYAIGAAGGGVLAPNGSFGLGGAGGYAGASGNSQLGPGKFYSVQVGCPGTWSKTATLGAGGGGSTAIVTVDASGDEKVRPSAAGPVEKDNAVLVAGGGGGATGGFNYPENGGDGGVIGTGAKDEGNNAPGGHGGGDKQSGWPGNADGQGTGGRGAESEQVGRGASGFGGNGADGYGRGFSGNYGGKGGAGAWGSGSAGWGGLGQPELFVPDYTGGGGGGGGGGYGGGGGGESSGTGTQAQNANSGGGGAGSFTSDFIPFHDPADPEADTGFFGIFPLLWDFTLMLPDGFAVPAAIVGDIVEKIGDAAAEHSQAVARLASPARSPLAFGYATVVWAQPRGVGAGLGATQARRDPSRPRLRGVTVSPRRFRVGPKPTAVTSAARPTTRGATFRFTLSKPGNVTVAIGRAVAGRRSGSRCVAVSRAPRRARACTRYLRVGRLVRHNRAYGYGEIPFSGRIGRRALPPGRYRATISAKDHARHRATSRHVTFTVLGG